MVLLLLLLIPVLMFLSAVLAATIHHGQVSVATNGRGSKRRGVHREALVICAPPCIVLCLWLAIELDPIATGLITAGVLVILAAIMSHALRALDRPESNRQSEMQADDPGSST